MVLAALIVAAHGAAAQSETAHTTPDLIGNLQASLRIVESSVERRNLGREEINSVRRQIEFVADAALRIRSEAIRKAEEQTNLLNALGPKPDETEPPEAARVAAERKRLEDSISEYQGRIKASNVLLARVDALRTRLSREEFDVMARVLSRRTETPLSPDLVGEALSAVPVQLRQFTDTVDAWWESIEFNRERFGTLMWWLVLLVLGLGVVLPTRNWVLRRYGPDHRDESPSFTRRFRVMLAVGLGNVVLPVATILGLYVVFLKSAAPTTDIQHMTVVLVAAGCQFFLVTGLAAAAMSPDYPNWRISHFTDASAVSLYRGIRLFASVIVILNVIRITVTGPYGPRQFAEMLDVSVMQGPLQTLFGAAVVVTVALSMLYILRRDNWWFAHTDEAGETATRPPGRVVRIFFPVAKLGLMLSIAAALVGYVTLGIFLAQRIVWSLLLVAFAYLLRSFIAATCSQAAGAQPATGSLLRDTLGYTKSGAARLMFWVMLAVDVVLVLAVIVILLLIWGVQTGDIQSTANKVFYGFAVGSFTLSLLDVVVALGIFLVLFFAVRLFQNFLSKRVLAQTVPDVGVRDALTTGVGYAGIIVAAIIAISSLGLQLSQLAIIFGALSVGIGFGLQHVVNNFVSGLILLMQRPIKAGDWIVVGPNEGYVKKINVVATEIQTFDNATVIVPNSQLVTSEVKNWTHKSTVARVIVSVGVSYDSQPRQVRDILLQCAVRRDEVLRVPSPTVVFRDFGDSALIFELRFFIRQADYMLIMASDLRFDIADAFAAAGIVIPFPQRDIHIKDQAAATDVTAGKKAGTTQAAPAESKPRARAARRYKGESLDNADGDGDGE
jgi:small-conductance mechanosensitive channel